MGIWKWGIYGLMGGAFMTYEWGLNERGSYGKVAVSFGNMLK